MTTTGEKILVSTEVSTIRRTHPVHITGTGWSRENGEGYLGATVQQDGETNSIELIMDTAKNHRGWSITDVAVQHNAPGSAVFVKGGSFGRIVDVQVDGYSGADVLIELEDLMAFRGERIKANNFQRYGITDHNCRGGNHVLMDCHISSKKDNALAAAKLNMNGWRIEGGEYNALTENGVSILFERNEISGSGTTVFIYNTRMELDGPTQRGCVFDSVHTEPWTGGVVDSPTFVLKVPGCIGCDFQFCDSIVLQNPGCGHLVDGAFLWRFGPRARNCTVIENSVPPAVGVNFLDESEAGSGNCVIYRGQVIYKT